jgi:hypothetical protein
MNPEMNTSPNNSGPNHSAEFIMAVTFALNTTARLQGKVIDRLRLHQATTKYAVELSDTNSQNWQEHLRGVALAAGVEALDWYKQPDPARLPAIAWFSDLGWVVIRSQTPSGDWLIDREKPLCVRRRPPVCAGRSAVD